VQAIEWNDSKCKGRGQKLRKAKMPSANVFLFCSVVIGFICLLVDGFGIWDLVRESGNEGGKSTVLIFDSTFDQLVWWVNFGVWVILTHGFKYVVACSLAGNFQRDMLETLMGIFLNSFHLHTCFFFGGGCGMLRHMDWFISHIWKQKASSSF
jgi:hypothetical protein